MDEFAFAARAVLLAAGLVTAVVTGELRSLGRQELGMLTRILGVQAGGVVLLRQALTALGQPLLHDEAAFLPSLYGGAAAVVLAGVLAARDLRAAWVSYSLVLADGGQGALAVGLSLIDQLVRGRALSIRRVRAVLVRAARPRLAVGLQRAQVQLLRLLLRLVRLLACCRLLERHAALLHQSRVRPGTRSLACLGQDLLRLFLLRAVVSGVGLSVPCAIAFQEVWVAVHDLFDVPVVCRLVIDGPLAGALVQAHLELVELVEALSALQVGELLLILNALNC